MSRKLNVTLVVNVGRWLDLPAFVAIFFDEIKARQYVLENSSSQNILEIMNVTTNDEWLEDLK